MPGTYIKEDTDAAKEFNKIVVLAYVGNNHYDLIVFDNKVDTTRKSSVQGKQKTKGGTRRKLTSSHQCKFTRESKIRCNWRISVCCYKKESSVFQENENNNPNFRLPSPTASDLTDTPKLPQLDDLTFGLPIYFYMFLYSYYNTIKDKKDESLRYNYFSMFFSEYIDRQVN